MAARDALPELAVVTLGVMGEGAGILVLETISDVLAAILARDPDLSAVPAVLEEVTERLGPVSVLADREAWPHLPPHHERCPRCDGHGEATLSVNVSGDVGREELATVSGAGV